VVKLERLLQPAKVSFAGCKANLDPKGNFVALGRHGIPWIHTSTFQTLSEVYGCKRGRKKISSDFINALKISSSSIISLLIEDLEEFQELIESKIYPFVHTKVDILDNLVVKRFISIVMPRRGFRRSSAIFDVVKELQNSTYNGELSFIAHEASLRDLNVRRSATVFSYPRNLITKGRSKTDSVTIGKGSKIQYRLVDVMPTGCIGT
jgi:hypothetical protein